MSWREREFRHESDAYYRSLDQAVSSDAPQEACMGGHVENGKTVCDWFRCQGKRIEFLYLRERNHVYVHIEGVRHPYYIRNREQLALISAARKLAEKNLVVGSAKAPAGGAM